MLRLALFALAAVVALLIVVSLLPKRERPVPEGEILLRNTRLTLYPESDPGAVWHFRAPEASYDPDTSETTLLQLEDGERVEGDEVDFTVRSDRVVIDANDNLRGEELFVNLVKTDECLTMLGDETDPVLIDQQAGRFIVPVMKVDGRAWGDNSVFPKVRASFDLQEFNSGGEGTTTVTELFSNPDETRSNPCEDF